METADITFRTRKWVRSEDLNANGTLFGGSLLKWIDEEAAIYAILQQAAAKKRPVGVEVLGPDPLAGAERDVCCFHRLRLAERTAGAPTVTGPRCRAFLGHGRV